MKHREIKIRLCPICGQEYAEAPAISRTDNITQICPECGSRQALKSMGLDEAEIDAIIAVMANNTRREAN